MAGREKARVGAREKKGERGREVWAESIRPKRGNEVRERAKPGQANRRREGRGLEIGFSFVFLI